MSARDRGMIWRVSGWLLLCLRAGWTATRGRWSCVSCVEIAQTDESCAWLCVAGEQDEAVRYTDCTGMSGSN